MEVGDYVRTELNAIDIQLISKIKKICDEDLVLTTNGYWDKEMIIKSSPNIIDLIEVGDYVNGHKVRAVYLDGNTPYIKLGPKDKEGTRIYEKDIKSVLTHEQFESMQYNLESEVN